MGNNQSVPESTQGTNPKLLEPNRVIVRVWTGSYNNGAGIGHVSIEIEKHDRYISLWPKFHEAIVYNEDDGEYYTESLKTPCNNDNLEATTAKAVLFKPAQPLLHSYEQDLEAEHREPEKTFCFYTLDTEAMVAQYEKHKSEVKGWIAIPGLLCDCAESCASLAWDILVCGGILNYIKAIETSSNLSKNTSGASGYGSKQVVKGVFGRSQSRANNNNEDHKANAKGAMFFSSEMLVGSVVKSPDVLANTYLLQAKTGELKKEPGSRKLSYPGEVNIVLKKKKSSSSSLKKGGPGKFSNNNN